MTTTQFEALDAMLRHHQSLVNDVGRFVAQLADRRKGPTGFESARAELLAFLSEEVIPHALAEEATVYKTAMAIEELRPTVRDMTSEHRTLIDASEALAGAANVTAAIDVATRIESLFSHHVERANVVLLPALFNSGVDLADLIKRMRAELSPTRGVASRFAHDDPTAAVLSLLFDATTDLARVGEGERACSLATSAWTALRASRPDLATSVTARLHRLARSVNTEPVVLRARGTQHDDDALAELDVRPLAPAQRHEAIFERYHALALGEGYLLVNDHDPVPLRYQFEAEYPGAFTWDVLEAGPKVWRVRIERPGEYLSPDSGCAPTLDVRTMPHASRHEEIFATFDRVGDR